ncbi:GNAT family N-acetyltransferase [Streptomyces sp. LHD-70]|uniref:GNAT family N-acetyltransferase n=1 Tax=Streptomyces sp. LHD-70 TaxID=3072140 RepID=UPI00280E4106|nr:GNAT family N-acetyltransferase [Streptomyces sp. LHD-70]MDQ8707279.1 GNAT family N-acetyltransferase [Streptomyces sp. LHD-70]
MRCPEHLQTLDITPDSPRMRAEVRPLFRALRPALTDEAFERFAVEAYGQGLVFTAAYGSSGTDGGACLAVATHRTLATSRGRILHVDDLVTDAGRRSGGVGARLFDVLVGRARAAGCDGVELDSGVTNVAAHRFYHARRMSIGALHFRLDVHA